MKGFAQKGGGYESVLYRAFLNPYSHEQTLHPKASGPIPKAKPPTNKPTACARGAHTPSECLPKPQPCIRGLLPGSREALKAGGRKAQWGTTGLPGLKVSFEGSGCKEAYQGSKLRLGVSLMVP